MRHNQDAPFLQGLIQKSTPQNDRFERELLHQSSLSKRSFWMINSLIFLYEPLQKGGYYFDQALAASIFQYIS